MFYFYKPFWKGEFFLSNKKNKLKVEKQPPHSKKTLSMC